MLNRDKDADITWLYGPWKRNASFCPPRSTHQLRDRELIDLPSSLPAHDPCQNKLGPDELQGILLRPLPSVSHDLTKRRVWFKSGLQEPPNYMLTITGEIVSISHKKEIAPGPFQPGGPTVFLSPAQYPLGSSYLAPNVQAESLLVGQRPLKFIFVVQSPPIWTYCVVFATSASEAY